MLVVLLALIALVIVARLAAIIKTDGYGRRPPPRSHIDAFAPPERFR